MLHRTAIADAAELGQCVNDGWVWAGFAYATQSAALTSASGSFISTNATMAEPSTKPPVSLGPEDMVRDAAWSA